MSDAKKSNTSSVVTVKFGEKSQESIDALNFLKTFKRRQGRFLTTLITWYLQQDRLYYDSETDQMIDLEPYGLTKEDILNDAESLSRVLLDALDGKEKCLQEREQRLAELESSLNDDSNAESNQEEELNAVENVPLQESKLQEKQEKDSNSTINATDSPESDDEDSDDDFEFFTQMAKF